MNFYSTSVNLESLDLDSTEIPWASMFHDSQQPHYSLDKQIWTYWTQTPNKPALPPPLSTLPVRCVIGRCLSLSLHLWVSVSLTLVWLGLLSSWSHQSVWGPVKAISPIFASSVPVSALRDWLTPPRCLHSFALGRRQHISSFNRQSHLHAHKSLSELTRSHTTRHDTVSQNSVRQIAMLCDIRLQGKKNKKNTGYNLLSEKEPIKLKEHLKTHMAHIWNQCYFQFLAACMSEESAETLTRILF